ncbi:MAG: murein biosynthesis integral membrane protein MurJ [Spirochaetia bacterium]|nr:murein biosynthesis integral membrane protein MurJ [Spirochaetia bacterium]
MGTKKKSSLLRSGLILSIMTFASRIMGLIREMTKAAFLGTGLYADAFSVAFMIPNLLRRLFAENAISVAFIPTFKGYLEKGDDDETKKETQQFINSTFTLVTFLTSCIVVIGIIITPLLVPLFCKKPIDVQALDYLEQVKYWMLQKDEITILTRIMFPYLFVISVAAFFQGILNGCKIFAPSGFTPVLFNGIVILSTYILAPYTPDPAIAMSIGVILGGCVQALFQWPFLHNTGWKVCFTSLKKTFLNPGTRKVIALVAPTIVGMAAYQLNDLVSTFMATRTGEGIASGLQYSLRLQELILGIFAVSIGTVILPDLTGLANNKKWEEFNDMLIQSLKIMTLISIPVTAYSLVTGRELISLLYRGKAFDDTSVALTLGVFNFHICGLEFIALNRIISPAFYAQKNTKPPALAGIISFISNILLVLILVHPMGGNGIALALSIASFINTVFLFIFMRKMEAMNVKKVVISTILYAFKMIVYSVIAALPCYFLRPILLNTFAGHGKLIGYGLPVAILAVVFAVVGILELIITRDDMVKAIIGKFRK